METIVDWLKEENQYVYMQTWPSITDYFTNRELFHSLKHVKLNEIEKDDFYRMLPYHLKSKFKCSQLLSNMNTLALKHFTLSNQKWLEVFSEAGNKHHSKLQFKINEKYSALSVYLQSLEIKSLEGVKYVKVLSYE